RRRNRTPSGGRSRRPAGQDRRRPVLGTPLRHEVGRLRSARHARARARIRKGRELMKPKAVVGITMGDPAGIGPEIALKAALDPSVLSQAEPVIIGSLAVLRRV